MKEFIATERPKSVNTNQRSEPGEDDMNADFGMAVTLLFWTVTLALAATGRGRGRFARSGEICLEPSPGCAVYPLIPRRRRATGPSRDLPRAS